MKIEIQGIRFDSLTAEEAVKSALRPSNEPCTVTTPNALMLSACRKAPALRSLLNEASLVLPDGAGVMLAAKRQGTPFPARVAGIDFAEALLAAAAKRGSRVFLLGGGDGIAEEAAKRLTERHHGLCICGSYWGYFEKEGDENRRVVGMIRACRPDILPVCFGFPMQEKWIRENLPLLPSVQVAAGLGGSMDVWAGKYRRAPMRLQEHGMEWAWRMAQEPRRLKDLPTLISFYCRRN